MIAKEKVWLIHERRDGELTPLRLGLHERDRAATIEFCEIAADDIFVNPEAL